MEQHEGSRGRGGLRWEGLEEAPGKAGGWDRMEGSAETWACSAASGATLSMSQGPPGGRVPCTGEGDSHPADELQSLAAPPPALLLSVDNPVSHPGREIPTRVCVGLCRQRLCEPWVRFSRVHTSYVCDP